MPINFEKILGSHEKALMIQARRAGLLSANIVNADTPGYKSRDIDFRQILKQSQGDVMSMKRTSAGHMTSSGSSMTNFQTLYRVPAQPSLDGNTVDLDLEKAAYAENSVRYQTTLKFLGGRFKGLMGVLRGN
ncbi:MAG TPA: flagellar basal body rod protein FlgB [Gammaproteobacteria bacterium]|nr:flagellar basal body rod protein FlgB [Gammaproteobacteria bacterium]